MAGDFGGADKAVNSFLDTLRALGSVRLAMLGVMGLALIGFFVFLMGRAGTGDLALLYNDLEADEGGAIVEQLESMDVPFTVSANGSTIRVPSSEVGRLRLLLASQGLPSSGQVGYSLFDETSQFGTTDFQQRLNRQRAMEGELSRTIRTLDPVRTARVHLVLPQRELFSRNATDATASVTVETRPGRGLSADQVAAIQNLVAAAVPNLAPGKVAVVDSVGRMLSRPVNEDPATAFATRIEERRVNQEREYQRRIEEGIGRILGPQNVWATVAIEIDLEQISETRQTVDPEQTVLISTQTRDENEVSEDTEGDPPVTVEENLPGADIEQGNRQQSRSERTLSEVTENFDASRSTQIIQRESGGIRRLTASVLVNGRYVTADDGTVTYQALPAEEVEQFEQIVANAIGIDPNREDTVTIQNVQFLRPVFEEEEVDDNLLFGFPRDELVRVAETVLLAIVGLLVVLLVIRPLIAKALADSQAAAEKARQEEERLINEQTAMMPALASPSGGSGTDIVPVGEGEDIDRMIDINQVEGRVRQSSLRKIGELVEAHPAEAAAVLRSWMFQEA